MTASAETVVPRGWGDGCQTWELLSRSELAVFHERMPPGTAEVVHSHARALQFFFVLEGELRIHVMGQDHVVGRHQGLEVPPGEVHYVRNESGAPTEFLAIAHPNTTGDRCTAAVQRSP